MESNLRRVRVLVVALMVLGLAFTLLVPPTVYLDDVRLTEETKAMIRSQRMTIGLLSGDPSAMEPIPDVVTGEVLGRMPIWAFRDGKAINWTGWTSEQQKLLSGTSRMSFINGVLFQVLIIVLVGALILSWVNRRLLPKEPAVEAPAETPAVE